VVEAAEVVEAADLAAETVVAAAGSTFGR
jgi:hypothetical protein